MNPLHISEPCSENWHAMTPTSSGAFCVSCSKEVIDFTGKSPEELRRLLRENLGKSICGRMQESQMDAFNTAVSNWQQSRVQYMRVASFLTFIAVFGMTLFSCQTPEAQMSLTQWQRTLSEKVDISPEHAIPSEEIQTPQQTPARSVLPLYADLKEFYIEREVEIDQPLQLVQLDEVTMGKVMVSHAVEEYLTSVPHEVEVRYDHNGVAIPQSYEDLVFPNPSGGLSTYKLGLPQDGTFVIGLYDLQGRHLRNLHEGPLEAGTHEFGVNVIDEPPGTFMIVCRSKQFSHTQRFIKL